MYDVIKTVTIESAWTCSIILKYFFRNICNRCIGWNMHSRISIVITSRAALLKLRADSWILKFLIVLLLRILKYMINSITWKYLTKCSCLFFKYITKNNSVLKIYLWMSLFFIHGELCKNRIFWDPFWALWKFMPMILIQLSLATHLPGWGCWIKISSASQLENDAYLSLKLELGRAWQ